MSIQKPLAGEYKIVIHVSQSGRATCYALHLPSTTSSYGNTLLGRSEVFLSDVELMDGDWGSLLERAAGALAEGV